MLGVLFFAASLCHTKYKSQDYSGPTQCHTHNGAQSKCATNPCRMAALTSASHGSGNTKNKEKPNTTNNNNRSDPRHRLLQRLTHLPLMRIILRQRETTIYAKIVCNFSYVCRVRRELKWFGVCKIGKKSFSVAAICRRRGTFARDVAHKCSHSHTFYDHPLCVCEWKFSKTRIFLMAVR